MFSNHTVAPLTPVEMDVLAHGKEESQFLRLLPYKSELLLKGCTNAHKTDTHVKTRAHSY